MAGVSIILIAISSLITPSPRLIRNITTSAHAEPCRAALGAVSVISGCAVRRPVDGRRAIHRAAHSRPRDGKAVIHSAVSSRPIDGQKSIHHTSIRRSTDRRKAIHWSNLRRSGDARRSRPVAVVLRSRRLRSLRHRAVVHGTFCTGHKPMSTRQMSIALNANRIASNVLMHPKTTTETAGLRRQD